MENSASGSSEILKTPQRAQKYRQAYLDNLKENKEKLPILKALSMFVEAGLSRKQYEIIAATNKGFFPCYSILQKAKKDCYPIQGSYTVTETLVEVNLQNLLDHTTIQLLVYLHDVTASLNENECKFLELVTKWGCDGSQQSQYRQKFENSSESESGLYTMDTARLYVELYPWYPMTPTMHKILMHGSVIIENALLPIGQLSEEASEARNKHFRLYRLNYARKFSRRDCNIDVLNRLLLSSDPLIICLKKSRPKPRKSFSKKTLELLLPKDSNINNERLMSLGEDEISEDSFDEDSWPESSD